MSDHSSLSLLADVALRSFNEVIQPQNQKEPKSKKLKILRLNGEHLAELNDLKDLPISFLSRIFVERFEDTKLHHNIYICKFGMKACCNTKFKDIKEGKIQRMEHLIQCHLLQHLIKTKSDAMIKIPKRSVEFTKLYFHVAEPMPVSDPSFTLNHQCSEISLLPETRKNGTKFSNSTFENEENCEKFFSSYQNSKILNKNIITEPTYGGETKFIRINASKNAFEPQLVDNGLAEVKPSIVTFKVNPKFAVKRKTDITRQIPSSEVVNTSNLVGKKAYGKLTSDHSYAAAYTIRSIPEIGFKNHSVNIDHLYYLTNKPSLELSDFMIFETLPEPNSENKFDVHKLPLIESEVQVPADATVGISSSVDFPSIERKGLYVISSPWAYKENQCKLKKLKFSHNHPSDIVHLSMEKTNTSNEENNMHSTVYENNNHFCKTIKNCQIVNKHMKRKPDSGNILKSALLKNATSERPVINISNIWCNMNVQRL